MSIIYFPFAFFPSNLFYINYSALVLGGSFNLCRKWQQKKKKENGSKKQIFNYFQTNNNLTTLRQSEKSSTIIKTAVNIY